jgi:DNA-binding response OmpR family regulator
MLRRRIVKTKSDEPLYDLLDEEDDEEETLPHPKHHRVLIAEDDDPLRDMLETILRLEGHQVATVPSADAMFAMVNRNDHRFDVIVTDVRMPGASGLDVVATLRSTGHKIPIIVMTAFPDDGTRLRAESLNTLLIAKPFSLQAICLAIEALIARPDHRTQTTTRWKH